LATPGRHGRLFILFLDTDLALDGPKGQRDCVNAQLQSEAARMATRAARTETEHRLEADSVIDYHIRRHHPQRRARRAAVTDR